MAVITMTFTLASTPGDWKAVEQAILEDPKWAEVRRFGLKSLEIMTEADNPSSVVLHAQFPDVSSAKKAAQAVPAITYPASDRVLANVQKVTVFTTI
jgi:hypothetical protein